MKCVKIRQNSKSARKYNDRLRHHSAKCRLLTADLIIVVSATFPELSFLKLMHIRNIHDCNAATFIARHPFCFTCLNFCFDSAPSVPKFVFNDAKILPASL